MPRIARRVGEAVIARIRKLALVLGDQLAPEPAALSDLDPAHDAVWMAENETEATHVWSHKRRLARFFAAMRHHRDALRERGWTVHYHALTPDRRRDSGRDFGAILAAAVRRLRPERLIVAEPGDWRVRALLVATAERLSVPLTIRPDTHFYCGTDEFRDWAAGRKRLVMEDFYRHMRRRHDILMEGNAPVGGRWTLDRDNREPYSADGPPPTPGPVSFTPDAVTRDVLNLVATRYPEHPGRLEDFDLPVTPAQARTALADFVAHRLPDFGRWQDAMWSGEVFGHHSRLSAALNLHLLDPREAVAAAVAAHAEGHAPLNSVEGFVRQILGWREFVRGVYWLHMPDYAERNALGADLPVPRAFWDGETGMRCVAESMRGVLDHGYAHHIQRLMVLGLFALLAGVDPKAFHEWHMAMYCDAVDWVSLPNALGMSQYGDGGLLATKPYCASGNYIHRMSDYCRGCRFDHRRASGADACPVTTLYWDFLDRHHDELRGNRRLVFQVKNLERKRRDRPEMTAIRERAAELRRRLAAGETI